MVFVVVPIELFRLATYKIISQQDMKELLKSTLECYPKKITFAEHFY